MPIYEYACGKCEHEFEVEQRISEDPVKTCPKCRSRRVRRLISVTSFALKGSGWYSDGYSSSKGKANKEGSSESPSASSDSSSSSDASSKKDTASKSKSEKSKSSGTSKDAA